MIHCRDSYRALARGAPRAADPSEPGVTGSRFGKRRRDFLAAGGIVLLAGERWSRTKSTSNGIEGRLWAHRYQSSEVMFERAGAPPGAVSRAIGSLQRLPSEVVRRARRGREDSYALALNHFVTAIQNGSGVSPDLHDGLKILEVIEAAEEAARRECEVQMRPA